MIAILRVITLGFQAGHLVGGQPEKEEVLRCDFVANFDIGPIESSDGQGSVHREFHIAGPGGFFTSSRDLLGQIGRRVDVLAVLDVEIRKKDHLDEIADFGIAIDHLADRVYQLDDQLGHEVAWRCLSAEDECAGRHRECRVVFDAKVESNDVKDIQVLALIFVDALYVHIEECGGIDRDAGS